MKQFLPLLCSAACLILSISGSAQNEHGCQHLKHNRDWRFSSINRDRSSSVSISDSIDLIKHTVFLDLTNFSSQSKSTVCTIEFEALVDGVENLPLDLKEQTVDSVVHASGNLNYTYSNEILNVELPSVMNTGMMDQITVFYQGGEVTDPSGFGGFYWDPGIAYNIGVAFTDWPPSYGRAWIPCFDNFIEKSMYEFQVLTRGSITPYCNGHLQSADTITGDTVLTTWIMDREIPSYLASVTASDFERIEWAFESISGDTIPVYLAAEADDIVNLENNFENLETVFHAFEDWFGPYRWPKIGYCMTPVGAMEHSTNISYPPVLFGSGAAESVMAHELAHEWFGNLVTCDEPSDMWLNEGWAEFCSILAYEAIAGPEEYREIMRDNHHDVLHLAHYLDGGFLTMNQLPPEMTYGEHAYNKGACMAHTLRGYVGDDLFFDAMESYLNTNEYLNASSEDLRDFLNTQPGIDVTDFFNDWIFQPGWAQFSVDDFDAEPNGDNYSVTLEINQRLRGADSYYQNVPLTISLFDSEWNIFEQEVLVSGPTSTVEITAPFAPLYATANRNDKLSIAVTGEEKWIDSPNIQLFSHANVNLPVSALTDSVLLRIEQHWAGPGGDVVNDAYIVSPDRYWRVFGLQDENFSADLRLQFDGRNTSNGFYDVGLLAQFEDEFDEEELVVLYRSTPQEEWEPWSEVTIQTLGSSSNGQARLTVNDFAFGEYTFGYHNPNVGLEEAEDTNKLEVFPNPATDVINIQYPELVNSGQVAVVQVVDASGMVVLEKSLTESSSIATGDLARGAYLLRVVLNEVVIDNQKLVLR